MRERENLEFDTFIYLEPVKRFLNRSNAMKFRSFGDSSVTARAAELRTS